MEDGQLVDDPFLQARECLARRKQLLSTPVNELGAWAGHAWKETESTLHAWAVFDADPSFAVADAGYLAGRPIGVKDVIDVQGMPTAAGSKSRSAIGPSMMDAEVVRRLRAQGGQIIGKTVTTEFAYLDAGPSSNPFNKIRTPGGSSSGSAAAVGAGVVPLALGTQTAGSVCRPAAYCGVYAFKPSTRCTPTSGVVPFAPTFDTVGVMGLELELVSKTAMLTIGQPISNFSEGHLSRGRPVMGCIEDAYFEDISEECRKHLYGARKTLIQAGYRFRTFRLDLDFDHLRSVHRTVMQFEAYKNHGALLRTCPEELGDNWRGALTIGSKISFSDYDSALRALAEARKMILSITKEADILLLPPVRSTAPQGIGATGDAGLIVPWTYVGSPLVVLPTGLSSEALPIAIMLAGKPEGDMDTAYAAAGISVLLEREGLTVDS